MPTDDPSANDRGDARREDADGADGDDVPRGATDGDDTVDDGDGGFSLSLPPIRLPPLFPEDFRVLWPVGGRPRGRVSRRGVAAALLAFDAVDAALALTVDAAAVTAVRVVAGSLVAAAAFGALGVAYVWEAAAALAGAGELGAAPTLTLLLVARTLRDVL
ncbi:hypothetical protein [Halobacterium yunchengense]|uniref:hypothetical protein n=1 Tax=Halobacterium yunchengense TaxID=3108497 RepID=UPI00300A9B5E